MAEGQINKGGVCWAELNLDRASVGLVINIKTVPQVEEAVKALGDGGSSGIELYDKSWFPVELYNGRYQANPRGGLGVYNLNHELLSDSYALARPCEPLILPRDGKANISFLRMVGISNPDGVTFAVAGPVSRDYILNTLKPRLLTEVRNFVRDYIVPVHINLRISSQDA